MPSWRPVRRRRHVASTTTNVECQQAEHAPTRQSDGGPSTERLIHTEADRCDGRKRQRGRKRKTSEGEKEDVLETVPRTTKTQKKKARSKEKEGQEQTIAGKAQIEDSTKLQANPPKASAPAVDMPIQIDIKPLSQTELSNISVTGQGTDAPGMACWKSLEDIRLKGRWPPVILAFMEKFKCFKEPTPIQSHCWPVASAGRDLVGISKTGSGKTLAYALPCLAKIFSVKSKSISFGPYASILAPTRELALQIEKETKPLCRAANLNIVCLYGGASKGEQIKALGGGADLIVATPGRLYDFASIVDKFTGTTILSLSMVTYIVLDEADSMLDLGFEPQVRKIFNHIAQERQTLLFSATWPNKVQLLAREFLRNPVNVKIGSCDSFGGAGNHDVEQRILLTKIDHSGQADRIAKKEELWRILSEHYGEICLVFCSMKKTAAVIAHQLKEDGFEAKGLHGDIPQADRVGVLSSFREKQTKILVATDVAARGLDVDGISVVVNYDPAATREDHIHRIGRTGRAGKGGLAYTLIGLDDVQQAKYLVEVLRSAGQTVPADVAELASKRLENAKTRKCANLRAKKKAMRQEKRHET